MILIVDNTVGNKTLYTTMLKNYFVERNIPHRVVKTVKQIMHIIEKETIDGAVLGGSTLNVNSKVSMDKYVANIYLLVQLNIPILGICFGCQFLNVLFGGSLKPLGNEFCKMSVVYDIRNKKHTDAKFCLHYVVHDSSLSPHFMASFTTHINQEKVICGIQHNEKHIYGVLFHPESSPSTSYILDDFCTMCTNMRQR